MDNGMDCRRATCLVWREGVFKDVSFLHYILTKEWKTLYCGRCHHSTRNCQWIDPDAPCKTAHNLLYLYFEPKNSVCCRSCSKLSTTTQLTICFRNIDVTGSREAIESVYGVVDTEIEADRGKYSVLSTCPPFVHLRLIFWSPRDSWWFVCKSA